MKRPPFLAIILGAATIPMVSLLWRDNTILAALFIIISVAVLALRREYLSIYMLTALIGTTTESVCIISGAWSYSNPTFIIPVWLPLAWGLAGVVFRDIMDFFTANLRLTSPRVRLLPLQAVVILASFTAIVSLFWRDNLLTTALITILSAAALWSWRGTLDLTRFSVAFLVAPLMEMVCVYYGTWAYVYPIFLIPPWLPFIWGSLGIVLGRLDELVLTSLRGGHGSRAGRGP